MNAKLREFCLIVASLLLIFACGAAVGHRMGIAKGKEQAVSARSSPGPGAWEEASLRSLTAALGLTPAQQDRIRPELAVAAREIRAARGDALRHYQASLLDLIDRVSPSLESRQQERLAKDRQKLQSIFVDGIQGAGSAASGGTATPIPR